MSTSSTKTTTFSNKVSTENTAKMAVDEKKIINSHSNRLLSTNGFMRFSRGRMFHRRALHRITKWKSEQAKFQGKKTKKTAGSIQKKKQRLLGFQKKPIGGEHNKTERLVRLKRFVCKLECVWFFFAQRFVFSHVIIQLTNVQRNLLLNVKNSVTIHVVFDRRLHPVQLLFLLLVNMPEK